MQTAKQYYVRKITNGWLVCPTDDDGLAVSVKSHYCKDYKEIGELFISLGTREKLGVQGELDLNGGTTATIYP